MTEVLIMLKRFALAVFDITSLFAAACLVVLVAAPQAHAYVDPSVMTYTIQAVAGVAVALSAVLGVALRRTRRVLFRILKIDENANKIVDPEATAIDPSAINAADDLEKADAEAMSDKERLNRGPAPRRLPWPQRFVRALAGCGFLILTVFIAAPLEIVNASADSLNFGFFDAMPIVLVTGLVAILTSSLVLSLFRGRVFDWLLVIIVALGVGCYVQALLLNGPLPIADGTPLDLAKFKKITLISSLVWLVIIAGFLLLNAKKRTACRALVLAMSVGLIVVQGASLANISVNQMQSDKEEVPQTLVTSKGEFEVSSSDNIIVFVLDFFDTNLMNELLDEHPDVLDDFTGFTYYRNSVGSLIPTRYALPYLLSGEMPLEDDTYSSYINSRYQRSALMEDIHNQGYDVGIYTESIYSPWAFANFAGFTENIVEVGHLEINAPSLMRILTKVSLYRELPWILKPFFWFNTDEINVDSISNSMSPYVYDDAKYGQRLRGEGLAVSDSEKTFRFIHLNGAHWPLTLDENGNVAEGETDRPTQARGSLSIVSDYLQQLKDLGVYDDSFIIVTSDHGHFDTISGELDHSVTPIFLVKPRETTEEASQPLRISTIPTGHCDYPATLIDAAGGDTSSYGPTVFDITDNNRTRYYWTTYTDAEGKEDVALVQYEINGDSLDIENWTLTGRVLEVPKSE